MRHFSRIRGYITLCFPTVPEYDVILPSQADKHGSFASYNLNEHARKKRSTHKEPDEWYYNIRAFGKRMHLKVRKNDESLGPGLVLEKHHADGFKTAHQLPKRSYFTGHVTSDPSSLVAISNDDGGMVCQPFQCGIQEYLIK